MFYLGQKMEDDVELSAEDRIRKAFRADERRRYLDHVRMYRKYDSYQKRGKLIKSILPDDDTKASAYRRLKKMIKSILPDKKTIASAYEELKVIAKEELYEEDKKTIASTCKQYKEYLHAELLEDARRFVELKVKSIIEDRRRQW